jgi:peptide deformylase
MQIKILKHPNTFLRQSTQEVKFPLSEENNIILDNMIKVMYQANGIGLAANQIGHNKRMFVIDTSNEKDSPQVFINPIVKSKNNIKIKDIEGCL